ncbi:MAG TPA: AAA family ATPase [Polyangia bacterium]|nr:AAA family ATPase [Polyangia bacterium]
MLLLQDFFSDNRNRWYLADEEGCVVRIEGGSLVFDHRRDSNRSWSSYIHLPFQQLADFRVHVVLERTGGAQRSSFGLLWGCDLKSFSEFLIRSDGHVRVARYDGGALKPLVDWKHDPAIHPDDAINLLEIVRVQGGQVDFLVNRAVVASLDPKVFAALEGDAFGFLLRDRVRVKVHSLLVESSDPTKPGKTTSEREIKAVYKEHPPPADDSLEKVLAELHQLVGLEEIKKEVVHLAGFLRVQQERRRRGLKVGPTSLHMVLSGPPGTGKTTVARFLGRIFKHLGVLSKGHVVETDRAGLVGGWIGHTAIRVEDAVQAALGGVLFIDEAYALVPEKDNYRDFGHEAVQALLKRMEDHREQLAVVIAGYSKEMNRFLATNPGMRSRFTRHLRFPHLRPGELSRVLDLFCQEHGYVLDREAAREFRLLFEYAHARRAPTFGNARFVRNLFERIIERQATRVVDRLSTLSDEELCRILDDDLLAALSLTDQERIAVPLRAWMRKPRSDEDAPPLAGEDVQGEVEAPSLGVRPDTDLGTEPPEAAGPPVVDPWWSPARSPAGSPVSAPPIPASGTGAEEVSERLLYAERAAVRRDVSPPAAVDVPGPWLEGLVVVEPMIATASLTCHAVAFSPDGMFLASAHTADTIWLWHAATGKPLRSLMGFDEETRSVAYSPDGKTLAAGASDDTVRLWDMATGKLLRVLIGHDAGVRSVGFSPDGRILASGADDQQVRLWEVATGEPLRVLAGHEAGVRSVAFAPDGQTLASGASDNRVRLWKVATGKLLQSLAGHEAGVRSVAFSPDGRILASGSDDKTVRLWDVTTGKPLEVLHSSAGELRLGGRKSATGRPLQVLTGQDCAVRSVAFSPDGKTLAAGCEDKKVRLWEVPAGKPLCAFIGHHRDVRSVAFSPDGQTLASGSVDKKVRLWTVGTGEPRRTLTGYDNWVESVAFSPGGQTLAAASLDGTVRLWEVATGRPLRTLTGLDCTVECVAFSPDGQILAAGSIDTKVWLWEVATGRPLQSLTRQDGEPGGEVKGVAFSPDGQILAVTCDRAVRLWEVATGRALLTLAWQGQDLMDVAFSPDGQVLAVGCDDAVRLWEVATGRPLRALTGHGGWVQSVAFSPDGRLLASGAYDRTVRLWDVATGRPLRVLAGHRSEVTSVAFSPDGQILASGSEDRTVQLWEVGTGMFLRSLVGHGHKVQSIAFSPDGQTLASGSYDTTIRLWDAATGQCRVTLAHFLGGWVAFMPDGRYKMEGDVAGYFWHVIGLRRFEPGELDRHAPYLRLPSDAPLPAPPPRNR